VLAAGFGRVTGEVDEEELKVADLYQIKDIGDSERLFHAMWFVLERNFELLHSGSEG
jgi:hypothetical protein